VPRDVKPPCVICDIAIGIWQRGTSLNEKTQCKAKDADLARHFFEDDCANFRWHRVLKNLLWCQNVISKKFS
jgi:hypothetical protein